jgi:hypothetical protein
MRARTPARKRDLEQVAVALGEIARRTTRSDEQEPANPPAGTELREDRASSSQSH